MECRICVGCPEINASSNMVFVFSSIVGEERREYLPILQRPDTPTPRSPSPEVYPLVPQTATPPSSDEDADQKRELPAEIPGCEQWRIGGVRRQLFYRSPLVDYPSEASWGTIIPIERHLPSSGVLEKEIVCPRAIRATMTDGLTLYRPPVIRAPNAMDLLTSDHTTYAGHWSVVHNEHVDPEFSHTRDVVVCLHGKYLCRYCGDPNMQDTPRRPIPHAYQGIREHSSSIRNRNSRLNLIDVRQPAPSFRRRLRWSPVFPEK